MRCYKGLNARWDFGGPVGVEMTRTKEVRGLQARGST